MELKVNKLGGDITYMSELILDISDVKDLIRLAIYVTDVP